MLLHQTASLLRIALDHCIGDLQLTFVAANQVLEIFVVLAAILARGFQ